MLVLLLGSALAASPSPLPPSLTVEGAYAEAPRAVSEVEAALRGAGLLACFAEPDATTPPSNTLPAPMKIAMDIQAEGGVPLVRLEEAASLSEPGRCVASALKAVSFAPASGQAEVGFTLRATPTSAPAPQLSFADDEVSPTGPLLVTDQGGAVMGAIPAGAVPVGPAPGGLPPEIAAQIAGLVGKKGVQIGSDPASTATFGALILGSLDREVIDQVIAAELGAIRACYQNELSRNPGLAGTVTVKFVIASTGAVQSALTKATTLHNAAVESCVNGRISGLTFPGPKGGGIVIVSYPFTFTPG